MVSLKLKAVSLVSISIILVAIIIKRKSDDSLKEKLDVVLSGLLRAEQKGDVGPSTRIALGFGGCEDIFVDANALLDQLNFSVPEAPEHHDSMMTQDQFAQMFAYFFRYGAAAERYVENRTLFRQLTSEARKVVGARLALGGNAPAMARRLAMEGAEVLLAARFTAETIKLLPSTIRLIGEQLEEDEIHLVMEYKAGSNWGQYQANRANRFIVHHDVSNPYLETLEGLETELPNFNADVLVVGGLQMMDNVPMKKDVRQARLNKLQQLLAKTDRATKIHFEMASFSDEELMAEVLRSVVLYSDSLGMNEQELPNLVGVLTDGNVSLVADSHPRIANVLDQMRTVYNLLKDTEETDGKRKLTRLHLHTLAYQAILTTKTSNWKNSMSATAKASLTAHRYVCGSKFIDVMKAKLIMDDSFSTSTSSSASRIPLQENRPVSCWDEEDYTICLAPVLVCTDVLQTGGGGDNISSAGLLYQI